MRTTHLALVLLSTLLLVPSPGSAQQNRDGPRRTLYDGSAVVTVGDSEYTIRTLCDDASRPELGFTTEANRVTREATGGHYNMVSLRLRPWKDTGDVLVSLEGYVAWIPRPSSSGGLLSLEVDMSPASVMRNGTPVLLTYDMWQSGDRPPGRDGLRFEANCGARDPDAPSYRKLPGSGTD